MFHTPKKDMVSTRGAKKKQEQLKAEQEMDFVQECKSECLDATKEAADTKDTRSKMMEVTEVNKPGPSAERQSVRKSASKKLSTSSLAKKKRLLEIRAAEEKARVKLDLIDQKLAADLAQLEVEGSCSSISEDQTENNDRFVEKWLETSRQELTKQAEPGPAQMNTAGRPLTAAEPALAPARQPPPAYGGTDDTVHALASALKDLAASTTKNCNDKLLNRLCAPKDLPAYSGDPLEWLEFKRAYMESSEVCNFTDRENLWRLRKSLHGPAKQAVLALLIGVTSPDVVMSTLELQFGNPDVIVSRILQDLNRLRPISQEYQKDIIPFSIKVKNCVAAVTAIGCEQYLQAMDVVSVILSKLPSVLISKWSDYSFPLINQGDKPKLVILSDFLGDEALKITKTFVSVHSFNKQSYSENYRNRSQALLLNNELSHTSEVNNNNCKFCRASKHELVECKKFKKSLRRDRWNFVKRHGICYKCLKSRHKHDTCPEPPCDVDNCGLSHHRYLHYVVKKNSVPSNSVNVNMTDALTLSEPQVESVNYVTTNSYKVLLKTVPVYLRGPNGTFLCYALLDDGSSVTLISAALGTKLGLRGCKQTMRVCGAWDNSEVVCDSEVLDLDLINCEGTEFNIRARSVHNLNLPMQNVASVDLSSYELMKPEIKNIISDKQCKPELLIGQDNYDLLLPLQIIKGKPGEPYLTRTPLGWCIHGCLRSNCERNMSSQSTLFLSENQMNRSTEADLLQEMQEEMRQSFAIDALGVSSKPRLNMDDVKAKEHLDQTAKLIDGRWYVGLPWKDITCKMPDSYSNALTRLKGVEKKMKVNPGYAERYKQRIEHLFSNDYASPLEESPEPKSVWYLSHFGVDNPHKQNLRLVFDAAAKSHGMCLNDYIRKGPDLLISLYGIMMRFREQQIAVSGDIKDMFLRIKIQKEDQDALRFLWRESPEKPIQTYVMTSLIFGANCSPFVAQYIKNKNAEKYEQTMPEAVQAIYSQHYMDDYLDSLSNEDSTIKLVNDVTYIHKQGGFEIRNWSSNNPTVLKGLPSQPLRPAVALKNGQHYDGERTLGLIWFPDSDTLGFDVSFKKIPKQIMTGQTKPTKREMLRVVMSIFDVYGFLSPIIIKGKIMIQDVWRAQISWDDEISNDIYNRWLEWLRIMNNINNIKLPRYYASATRTAGARETHDDASSPTNESPRPMIAGAGPQSSSSSYTNLELHVFCDASTKAMCAVAYWRWTDVNNRINVAFISSKCRVTPVKYVSIPRLELQSALMAARLIDTINKEHRIKPNARYLWCDSATVLHWLRNDSRNYKAYVAHRLGEIDELTNKNEWRYVPTKLNVADIGTRETCDVDTIQDEWLYGPAFLYQKEVLWPLDSDVQRPDNCDVDLECVNTLHLTPGTLPAVPDPERFSSWLRLLRSTCVMLSFIEKCKRRTCDSDETLMERAEHLLIKYSQLRSFPDDVRNLQQKNKLDKKSKLLTLSPTLDDDGLLRLAGRIDAAHGITALVKRPVILDGRCHITHLIVKYYHVRACHANQEMVVNEIKQKYWIIRLRPTVKHVSSRCMLCRIKRARPLPPRMGDLPEARLAHHQRAFTFTGLDLFGPLDVTVGRRCEKRYGVIFTCLTVRAVHIELVSQLTTDALIMALRRMAARRGWPRYLYSDNGTNLRGADTELKRCVRELDERALKEGVTTYSMATTWVFIPPASPHWGGAWERLIRSIKDSLKVILKARAPREEILQTLLAEVELMINSRPLTHVSVEPYTSETLTPNHFLLGSSSGGPSLGAFDGSDSFLRKQWRISQRLADMFWRRWVREVLPDMRPRKKWHEEQRPLEVGDLALVVDPNSPRNVWPKGIIINVMPGKDGRVRVADIKLQSGTVLRRSATRIARIPMGDECCRTGEGNVHDVNLLI